MGIAQDPSGRRASAVIAWVVDGVVSLHVLADVDGYPVDVDKVVEELQPLIRKLGIRQIVFDPWTDRDMARGFKDPKALQSADYEAACEKFVQVVEAGKLRHDSDELTADMAYTVRRETAHGWMAVRASDQRPTTTSFAAIRAVYLATMPSQPKPQVY